MWWACGCAQQPPNLHHNTSNRAGSACHQASLHRPTARQQQPAKQKEARRKSWWPERQRFASSGPLSASTCASGDRDMSCIPKMENTRPCCHAKQQRRKTGPHTWTPHDAGCSDGTVQKPRRSECIEYLMSGCMSSLLHHHLLAYGQSYIRVQIKTSVD